MDRENKFNFTEDRLRKIEPPADGKRIYFYDATVTGLRLAVSAGGNKTFQFQAWSPEKQRPITQTIGKWPTMLLPDARNRAIQLMADIKGGKDPEQERREKRETMTVGEIVDRYISEHAKLHKKSWKDDEDRGRLHIKPAFGKRRVNEITADAVRTWHNKLTKIMKPASANRNLALLRSVYNTMLPDLPNPCRATKMFKEQSRDRFLQPAELQRFFQAIEEDREQFGPDIGDYLLLSLFTGARRANVLGMMWKDIDLDQGQWRIPGEQVKNRTIMLIPLVEEAQEILARRWKMASSVFVFPGSGKTGHLQEPWKGWSRIVKRADLADIRLHDLRRTMGSFQTISGASTAIVGKTLGHKHPASTAVYARMTLDPVRDAMSAAVALMKTPVKKKVVNIKG
jgi:integrase